MSKIWTILILSGLVISCFTGKISSMPEVILNTAEKTWNIFLNTALIMLFWSGIFQIAIDSNLINKLSKIIIKPMKKLFPELNVNSKSYEYICSNFIANFLGLGSAATPLGLKAFNYLQEENINKTIPSRSMITFICVNASSLTLIPTSILSYRNLNNGHTSNNLIILMILSTIISTLVAIFLDRLFYHIDKKKYKS